LAQSAFDLLGISFHEDKKGLLKQSTLLIFLEAATGFEPVNNGFSN